MKLSKRMRLLISKAVAFDGLVKAIGIRTLGEWSRAETRYEKRAIWREIDFDEVMEIILDTFLEIRRRKY